MRKAISHGLYGSEIREFLPDIKIINYRQLSKHNNIDDVLGSGNAVIILYEWVLNSGHWVCLFKDGNVVEHFDSYGVKPDHELKWTPKEFKKTYYNKIPHLVKLLWQSPYDIRYSHHQLQKESPNVSTCGRWAVLRLILKHLDEDQFAKLFKNKSMSPDYLVTLMTMLIKKYKK